MKKHILPTLGLLLIVLMIACKRDGLNTPKIDQQGTVEGMVTAPNNTTPIPNALVFIDDHGEIYYTYTNKQGQFSLKGPDGTHALHVQTGDGTNFRTVIDIDITKNQTTTLNNSIPIQLIQTGSLAYIGGAYDAIQEVLTQLGYTAQELTVADLDDLNTLVQYDAIFLNCGNNDVISTNGYANLNAYAMNGGSLYASDYAVRYFIGTENGGCANGRPGGFILDSKLCTEKTGSQGFLYANTIVNNDLAAHVGINQLDIEYDLGSWEQINTLDPSMWETLVSSSSGAPLMIRTSTFDASSSEDPNVGNITVGNNGNSWVTICHIPPGNPSNPITITISTNALQAHLDHGCSLGACNSTNGGNLYYTTFHNHPGGSNNTEMVSIMEWVILNM